MTSSRLPSLLAHAAIRPCRRQASRRPWWLGMCGVVVAVFQDVELAAAFGVEGGGPDRVVVCVCRGQYGPLKDSADEVGPAKVGVA
jgi:hypothetical protein